MTLQKLSKEEYKEMSFIELAQQIFEERKHAMPFKDLVDEIGSLLELKNAELRTSDDSVLYGFERGWAISYH